MESKVTKYTKEIRAQKWSEIVMECNSSGMSKKEWLKENNVKPKSFYYWQHKLRKQALETKEPDAVTEIVQINLQSKEIKSSQNNNSDKIIIRKCGIEIELPSNNASVEAILKGLASC